MKYSKLSDSSCTEVSAGWETEETGSKTQMFSGNVHRSGVHPVSQFTHNKDEQRYSHLSQPTCSVQTPKTLNV